MTPTVTVIIPVFNQARFVRQAVDSALAQTRVPIELIVINDGSTDETATELASYESEPRVRVIAQENRGVAAARNAGAALAQGELLAFLDADDIWLPEKLARQVERFVREPEVGLIHTGVLEVDEAGETLSVRMDGLEGDVALDLLLFQRPVILGGGSGMLIPATIFAELGGFDERLSTSADWDLFFRVAANHRVGFVPEIMLHYRIHGANMHGNIPAMRHDMLLGFAKAFEKADDELKRRRRFCYGRLHLVLAGSFLTVGQRGECWKHIMKALWYHPANLLDLFRRFRRD
ncbi:MAG: glycosyltransferase [Pyrinomonadaceae bacterium]